MEVFNYLFRSFRDLEEFIKENIPKDKEILLQIFSGYISEDFTKELIKVLKNYSNISFIGTTTSGEIIENSLLENKIVFSFSVFDKSHIKTLSINDISSFKAGEKISSFVTENTKLVIVFCDGLNSNASDLIKGYFSKPHLPPIVGGLGGDNLNFINTYVFSKDGILKNGVVAALIEGNLEVNIIRTFGWKKIGKKFNITKADKNVIYEIDNENVISYLKRYLGDEYVEMLPFSSTEIPFCCAFSKNNLRLIIKKDKRSVTLNGDVVVGGELQIAIPNLEYFNNVIKSIRALVSSISIEGVFIYGNIAKKVALQDEFTKELEFISSQTNVSGFFGYGEFGNDNSKKDGFENGGVVFVFLSEHFNHTVFKNFKVKNNYIYINKKSVSVKKSLGHFLNAITEELMEANEKLQKRIEEVLEENVKKNLIIQQQSKQAQLGEMISMIAHQWKQPLNVVSLYVENMLLSLNVFNNFNKDECIESCKKIKQEVKRMNEIIDNFSSFTKPETKPKVFSIEKTLNKALKLVSSQFKNRNIEIKTECNSKVKMKGYETLLEQVFINILVNSRDAFEASKTLNPKIEISCELKNGHMYICFTDNGGGIQKEILSKIFNPYFTTKGTKGTGLGLYMSKKIMNEKCDGDIKVKSKNGYTTFIISIGPKVLK